MMKNYTFYNVNSFFCNVQSKIILLFTFFYFAAFFSGQQKISTLQKLQISTEQISTAQQSLKRGQEKRADEKFSTPGKPFSINSNSSKKDALRKNSARISQADNPNQNSQISESGESPFEAMKGKAEVLTKRDAFSKSFKNTDGSFTAIIGSAPIHYKNKQGQFSDIDHSIQKNTDATYSHVNKTNLFESYFGATSDEGIKNVTNEGEIKEFLNTKMYWEVNGKEVGILQSANSKIKINEDQAVYNLYGKISAEFTVETGRRKLNYIIPDKSSLGKIPSNADYLVFSEDIILPKGWTHQVMKGGVLILDQNKKEIYLYENPNSFDGLNELNKEKNTFFETLLSGNVLKIETKVKTAWVFDSRRQFPIKVDPTLTVYPNNVTWWSGYDSEEGVNGIASGNLIVGYFNNFEIDGFSRFDLSGIPLGSTITAATTGVYHIPASGSGTLNNTRQLSVGACSVDPLINHSAGDVFNGYVPITFSNVVNIGNTATYKINTITPAGRTYIQNTALTKGFLTILAYPSGTFTYAGNYAVFGGYIQLQANKPYVSITYNLPPACTGTPTGGTTVLTPTTGTQGTIFVASVTGSTSATGLTYQWESALNSTGPWTSITGATFASYTGIAPFANGTIYYRRKITCNSSAFSYSTAVAFTTTCRPSHANGNFPGNGFGYVGISNVNIGTINNTTGYQNAAPAYNDYTSFSTDIGEGTTYPLKVTYKDDGSPTNPGTIGAWIDWNGDGDFNGANEFIGVQTNIINNAPFTVNVNVPAGTAIGTKRLRVRSVFSTEETLNANDACTTKVYGETEDYNVKVITVVSCDSITASASKSVICSGETVTLSSTSTTTGYTYTWYSDYDEQTSTGTLIGTGASIVINPTQSKAYTVFATKTGCTSINRNIVVVTVSSQPSAVISTPTSAINCSNEIVKLSVNGGTIPPIAMSESFNPDHSIPWLVSPKVTGGDPNDARWGLSESNPTGYYSGFVSNDNSDFVVVSSDYFGQTSGNSGLYSMESSLISPPFSLQDYSSPINLTFYHFYAHLPGQVARVEISTDGGLTYTPLQTYTATEGNYDAFVEKTINLNAYAGQPNVTLRFFYSGSKELFWAVDNVVVSGTPSTSTVTWSPITGLFTDAAGTVPYTGGNTTTVYAAPTLTTTYTVSAKTAVGCPSTQTIVVTQGNKQWMGSTDANWNTATNWAGNVIPNADFCVNIPNLTQKPVINVGTNAFAKNLTVQSGGNLEIAGNLTVTDFVKNLGGSAGNIIIESDGNLVQINDAAVNIGDLSARRLHTLTTLRKEYNYLSSPVSNQNMKAIFGNNPSNVPFVTKLNEPTNLFVNAVAADYLIKGKGFAVKEPKTIYVDSSGEGLANNEAQYKGEPNNGLITVDLSYTPNRGYNLAGNPYPSNLDIIDLYNNSTTALIDPNFRFWDNKVNEIYTQMGGAYQGYSYALFNAVTDTDGFGVAAPGDGSGPTSSKVPNRVIKVSQAFMVRALGNGAKLNFKNSVRKSDNGTEFFGKSSPYNRYRLQLVKSDGFTVQNGIAYFAAGNQDFGREDTRIPNSQASDALFSYAGEAKVVINGRSSFSSSDVVPLGLRHFAAGTYKIEAVDMEGVFGNGQSIYLKDKQLNILTDLTAGSYSFTSDSGEFTNRFEIVYVPGAVLSTDNTMKSNIEVYRDSNDFVVRTSGEVITKVEVYDAVGRMVMVIPGTTKEVRIDSNKMVEGLYIIKAHLKKGEPYTKKIRK